MQEFIEIKVTYFGREASKTLSWNQGHTLPCKTLHWNQVTHSRRVPSKALFWNQGHLQGTRVKSMSHTLTEYQSRPSLKSRQPARHFIEINVIRIHARPFVEIMATSCTREESRTRFRNQGNLQDSSLKSRSLGIMQDSSLKSRSYTLKE